MFHKKVIRSEADSAPVLPFFFFRCLEMALVLISYLAP